ncbi:MAG: IPExxxVDY family protein [Chitinophagaceae bacterium]|nr:IPExxxVDY family protein [Chitinophagaceae bacterium]MCB9045985.1 IPExxxVDY family protein [Chitinophagales bacterium]
MSSKLVLNMSGATEDFFSDTAMIGIGSAMPGYRFCWAINRDFDFDFVREPEYDVEYRPAKDHIHFFSLYQYEVPYSSCKHLLYQLRSEKKALLPEIKQLDYLWLICSPTANEEARMITENLRNLPEIQLAQIIPPDRLKNLNHLII